MMERLSLEGPRELTLYVTTACDAACDFCLRQTEGVEGSGTMRPDFVRQVLARFPTVRGVCIAGFGEPLLVPWLGEIVRECRDAGAFVGLITNGSRLAERADEIASWDLGDNGYASVSMNATNATAHQDVFRFRTPCWWRVLSGIRALCSREVNVGASFVVRRSNVHEMPAMVSLTSALKLRFAHLHGLLPHAGPHSAAFCDEALREGDATVEAAVAAARKLPGADRVTFPTLLPARGAPSPARCQSPFMSVGVDTRGYVTGCRRIEAPSASWGRFDDPNVWLSPRFCEYRAELATGRPNETCRACFGSVRG